MKARAGTKAGGVDRCEQAPLTRAFFVLQEKWVLFIVRALLDGPIGFNELGRRAKGVSPATLALRLEHLEAEGLVTKQVISTMPPKTEYRATAAGEALRPVLEAIEAWASRHLR